jgi:hypothetical protein
MVDTAVAPGLIELGIDAAIENSDCVTDTDAVPVPAV